MKKLTRQSTNVEDRRRERLAKPPTKNPFSYAAGRDGVDTSRGYNGQNDNVQIKNNPFQKGIDALQKQGEAGAAKLKREIGQDIGQLNRTDENGYNIRSRARAGALRPNTRSS